MFLFITLVFVNGVTLALPVFPKWNCFSNTGMTSFVNFLPVFATFLAVAIVKKTIFLRLSWIK